jgi:hypothetical protein
MRTRIALVATIPVALMTVSTVTQAASAQSTRNTRASSRHAVDSAAVAMPPTESVAYRALTPGSTDPNRHLPFELDSGLLGARIITSSGRTTPDTAAIAALVAAPAHRTVPATATHAAAAKAASSATRAATPVPATPAPAGPVDTVTPYQRAAWERVAMCEEGGDWNSDGSTFSGGLGISRANWDAYGGLQYAAEGAEATEDEQIMVAERIQGDPPDQYGCRGW